MDALCRLFFSITILSYFPAPECELLIVVAKKRTEPWFFVVSENQEKS